ncbi:hypothetical protein KM620_gp034 [Hyposidra talaca nucleopolyhedrovirus]|uniref:Uncharacterized protein n=1 Tax=Hyposidra talaca nucleopolyhedrovirus TaxID=1070315 RepID=A0A2Z4HHZ5_9ABAC|nr:hypothetical protein KM620_gp034 [Hyposidra talaca nucleopolyhedrovirus]AWW14394.1 hypothetical protein HytaNPV_gp034 [Hyposidra talaca nucleopolyhedrovirus]
MYVLMDTRKRRITVYPTEDEYYFDFVEIRKFTSNRFKTDKLRQRIGRVSKIYVKKRYIKLCEVLLYLYCFEDTDDVIEFIYNNVYLKCYNNK